MSSAGETGEGSWPSEQDKHRKVEMQTSQKEGRENKGSFEMFCTDYSVLWDT